MYGSLSARINVCSCRSMLHKTACLVVIVILAAAAAITSAARPSYHSLRFAGQDIHVGDFDTGDGADGGGPIIVQADGGGGPGYQQPWPPYNVITSTTDDRDGVDGSSGNGATVSTTANCPVEPPCFCTTSLQTSGNGSPIVLQRIKCGVFGMTPSLPPTPTMSGAGTGSRSRRRKLNDGDDVDRRRKRKRKRRRKKKNRNKLRQGGGNAATSSSSSSSASSRRFPRFVESNDAVERQVSLSYSGLTSIPGAAFHAIKVTQRHTSSCGKTLETQ